MSPSLRAAVLLVATLVTLAGVYRTFVRALRRNEGENYELGSGRVFDAFTTDTGTWFFAAVVLVAIVDGLWGSSRFEAGLRDVAVAVFLAFCAALLWTDSMLKAHFDSYREGEPALMTTGPYAVVRHPRYSCWIGLLGSFSAALGSGLGLIATGLFALVVIRRVVLEERFLLELYRDRYRRYAKSTYRLLPWLW